MSSSSSEGVVSRRSATAASARRSTQRAPRWHDADLHNGNEDNVIDLREVRRERVARHRSVSNPPQTRHRVSSHHEEESQKSSTASTRGAARVKTRATCPPCHWGLILVTLVMAVASVPMVYSASQSLVLDGKRSPDFFLIRQLIFVAVGIVMMIAVSRLSAKATRSLAWVLYFVAFLGLVATKFSPLGITMGNVERWVKVGPIPLQVSEIAKFALIGVLADFWSRAAAPSQKSTWPWVAAFSIALVPAILVFIQPHLSATLVLFALPIIIGFYSGAPIKQIGVLFGGLAVIAALVVALCWFGKMPGLKPYQQDRITQFLSKDSAKKDKAKEDAHYQTQQGLLAIERGGLTGTGPGGSLFKHGHLPAPHTDFILAVIGEETGLVGMMALLALYGAMIFFCFQIAHSAANQFEMLLCSGVGSLLALQVICNLGVVLDVMPVTGMPLPMMSYGGSGLLCTLLGIGWVLGVSRNGAREEALPKSAPVSAAS